MEPAKELVWKIMERFGQMRDAVRPYPMSVRKFDSRPRNVGLAKVRRTTLGFGPFRFFGREVMSPSVALKVHRWLQYLLECGFPLAHCGAQYMLLAQKCNHEQYQPVQTSEAVADLVALSAPL